MDTIFCYKDVCNEQKKKVLVYVLLCWQRENKLDELFVSKTCDWSHFENIMHAFLDAIEAIASIPLVIALVSFEMVQCVSNHLYVLN